MNGLFTATARVNPDTGAEATVAGLNVLEVLDEDTHNLPHQDEDNLIAANGPLESAGRLEYLVKYSGGSTKVSIVFSRDCKGLLLSWFTCKAFGIVIDTVDID